LENESVDVGAVAAALARPAVHVTHTLESSKSYLGGDPVLPESIPWPTWRGRKLAHLARLSLPQLQSAHSFTWLPSEGALLFFYDWEEQPWGFDPGDRGGAIVLHVPDLPSPELAPSGERDDGLLPRVNVEFKEIQSMPSIYSDAVCEHMLNDEEEESYTSLVESQFRGEPKHQVGGIPSPVQGDEMEFQCQLVTNGLYCGDGQAYLSAEAERLKPGSADWKLLFQFDSDNDLDVMWGDCGTLYFWIRQQDSVAGSFDKAWLILQCS
jgi:uncharacterized protein YwqG